ncbi:hypothetical protein [Streptomyces sp. NPDC003077]|uniref:hypothetical protein n=1 Tax=Streptomyces sp. NPDC003077 TaxID=3154443 RepID=UPI00339E8C47
MSNRAQLVTTFTHTVFAAGLALVAAGAAADSPRRMSIGAGLTLGSLPFVVGSQVRRHHSLARDEAEQLRQEGYRLGLDHVARGLLVGPPLPAAADRAQPAVRHLPTVPPCPA